MPGLSLKVTSAGRAAMVNAQNTGTNAVLIASVGISAQPFSAATGMTSLPGEIKRLTTIGGTITAADTIHVSISDDSTDVYDCYGFGVYLDDGTLFAAYGQDDLLIGKADASMLLLAVDATFVDVDATLIEFGATNFTVPAATTEVAGVVELATEDEAIGGADKVRAITAWLLKRVLNARLGASAPTDFTKALLALATAAAFRTALEIKGAALKDEGSGKGLDADTVDGYHADAFAQAGHTHAIAAVSGLQAALDGKAGISHGHAISDVTGLQSALDGKQPAGDYAAVGHTHPIGNITGLQAALDGKQPVGNYSLAGHTHAIGNITGLQAALDGKQPAGNYALASHTHTIGNVTGLQAALDGKQPAGNYAAASHTHTIANVTGLQAALNDKQAAGFITATETYARLHGSQGQNIGGCIRVTGTPNFQWTVDGEVKWGVNVNGDQTVGRNISVAGAISAAGGFQPSSSRELKTAIRPNPYGLDAVLKLQTALGKYRKWFNPDGRERVFLFHENMAEVIPQAASGPGIEAKPPRARHSRKFGGYDLDQLVAVYAKAFQDLHEIVKAQGERIAALETNRS